MLETTPVGLNLAKNVFPVHGTDAIGIAVLRRRLLLGSGTEQART